MSTYYGYTVTVTRRGFYLVRPVAGGQHSLYDVVGTVKNADIVLVGGRNETLRRAAVSAHRIDNPSSFVPPQQHAPTAGSLGLQRVSKLGQMAQAA